MISIVIPIGPQPYYQRYLSECFESIRNQTMQPHTTVIIDDMANVDRFMVQRDVMHPLIWKAPWRLGVAHAFNMGVGVSPTECCILLGADDTLDPECLECCWNAYNHSQFPDKTYFALGVKYMDTGEEQFLACGGAMVTKSLWRLTGGFPLEAACGASDTMLLSIIKAAGGRAGAVTLVDEERTLYNYRRHDLSDTAGRFRWQNVIWDTRGLVTELWQEPSWGRYE